MRRLNKKGFFLAEETMKILLAVICLGFLIFVLGKMYYTYATDKDLQQAKDTLSKIEKEINSMKAEDSREIVIYGPVPGTFTGKVNYWILMSFSGQGKPSSCTADCLCICKNVWVEAAKSYETKCDEDKVCASFSGKTLPVQSINLENLPITVLFSQSKNTIIFSKK